MLDAQSLMRTCLDIAVGRMSQNPVKRVARAKFGDPQAPRMFPCYKGILHGDAGREAGKKWL